MADEGTELFNELLAQIRDRKSPNPAQAISSGLGQLNITPGQLALQGGGDIAPGVSPRFLAGVGSFARGFNQGFEGAQPQPTEQISALDQARINKLQAETSDVGKTSVIPRAYSEDTIVQNPIGQYVFVSKGTPFQVADDKIKSNTSAFASYDFDVKNNPFNYLKLGRTIWFKSGQKEANMPQTYLDQLAVFGLTKEDLASFIGGTHSLNER